MPSLLTAAPPAAWPDSLSPDRLSAIDAPTPFLAFDAEAIEARYRYMTGLLPQMEVFFALKCNPHPAVLDTVAAAGASFEIASAYELTLACATGIRPDEVLYSNTVKPPLHVEQTFAAGVRRFAFDSDQELGKLARYAPGSSVYARIAVDDEHSLFPLSKKFGTTVEDAVRLLGQAPGLGLNPYGVTFHVGSQCTNPMAWKRALVRCGILMTQLERQGIRLEMVNIGGGFPACYAEPIPTLDEIAEAIHGGLARLPYQPALLASEPGRALAAEAAVMASTVIGVEDRRGERWVYLDVGGYNGMMEPVQTGGRWPFRLDTSRPPGELLTPATVTGPSCDSSDTMFYDVDLPAGLETGDRVYIGTAGAYTNSYASNFNGFPAPEVLFVGDRAHGRLSGPIRLRASA